MAIEFIILDWISAIVKTITVPCLTAGTSQRQAAITITSKTVQQFKEQSGISKFKKEVK